MASLYPHQSHAYSSSKRSYVNIVGKTLDLKISHKKKIYPNQIEVLGRTESILKGGLYYYKVRDTVYGNTLGLTYYEIAHYYLGRPYKRHRLLVPTFQIVSNPVLKYSDIYKTKFDIMGKNKKL